MAEFTIYNADCLDIMRGMDADSVDAVIFDPPYGIEGSSGTINKLRAKGEYNTAFEDTPEYIRDFVVPFVKECIQKFGSVILTPGNKNFSLYPQPDSFGTFYQPAAVGLQVFGNLDAQPIFYYGKNATKKNMGKRCSFVMTSRPDEVAHPCRKPTKEWRELILNHTLPGQTVFDPMMGSGTTGEICMAENRRFFGCELDPGYFKIAQDRITKAQHMSRGEFVPIVDKAESMADFPLFAI